MTHKVYQYLPDLKVLREKPLDESHYHGPLTTYPASGFGKEHEGRDLVEDKDFKVLEFPQHGYPINRETKLLAVPLEAEAEKQGEYNNDPKLLQRVANLERDLEYLYKHLKIDLY